MVRLWINGETFSDLHQHCRCRTGEEKLDVTRPIIKEKAKRPDYARKSRRISSFTNWCPAVMDPKQLAEAGFYYSGVPGCVRCFFCGGGMKNWKNGDNAWIEHARWFQNCTHVTQCMGVKFVQMIANGEMQNLATTEQCRTLVENQFLEGLDKAAIKLVKGGYKQEKVEHATKFAREKLDSSELRALYILESLLDNTYNSNDGTQTYRYQSRCDTDRRSSTKGEQQKLLEENSQLKRKMACKICLELDTCIVFRPCGHMVSCVECAHALRECAVCRSPIVETFRAYQA